LGFDLDGVTSEVRGGGDAHDNVLSILAFGEVRIKRKLG
jgi:hypothetical protein